MNYPGKIIHVHPQKQWEIFGMKETGISLPPYSTYKQSFNVRYVVLAGDIT